MSNVNENQHQRIVERLRELYGEDDEGEARVKPSIAEMKKGACCALKEIAKMRKEHPNKDTVNRGLDLIEVFALQSLLVDDPE